MIRSDGDAALEEYGLLLQVVRDHMLRRQGPGQPLVLQLQSDGAEGGDHVTFLLGQVVADPPDPVRRQPRPGDGSGPPAASLPFLAELGPLLLQALAMQVIFGEQRRRMAAPLDQEAVGRLQRMKINRDIVAQLEMEGQGVCSICQEAFSAGCEVYRLPCGHMFDVLCLKQWLERTRTCPNCRFILQDVDQQYRDVVAPTWWRSAGESAEEREGKKCQCVATVLGGEAPAHSRLPTSLVVEVADAEVRSRHPQLPQQTLRTQQQQPQQQRLLGLLPQPVGTLRAPSPVSLSSMTDREASLEGNGGYSFLSIYGAPAHRGVNLEPVPPPTVPQRTGGAFREERFAEEAVTPPSHAPSRLSELRIAGNVNRASQRRDRLPVHEEQWSTPLHWSELSLPSSGTLEGDAAASPAIASTVGEAPFSLAQHVISDGGGDDVSTSLPRGTPRSEESQTFGGDTLIQNVLLPPQPTGTPAVAGSARQVVQALRRQRAEEVRRVRPTNSSSNSGNRTEVHNGISDRCPPRHRPAFSRRFTAHPGPNPPPPPLLAPPHPSLPWIPVERQRRVSMNSSSGGGHNGPLLTGDSQSQQSRGSRRNLARYEAVIRGQQGRRW
ncbi:zinc finger protein, predicted [Trypanosoma conorhini]|uniref:Zinc finger protein, predicted n=1 Tax=Trypanosoma conorhini TaxID=83891 RepID=A0A422NVZ4_9TRYP|nr:zinc finger protein, predicted [Trypanosoma conorhini]RNF09650.1 zinc finger protein, predicted [Trypanosoma conorhini]